MTLLDTGGVVRIKNSVVSPRRGGTLLCDCWDSCHSSSCCGGFDGSRRKPTIRLQRTSPRSQSRRASSSSSRLIQQQDYLMVRQLLLLTIVIFVFAFDVVIVVVDASKTPEASSTLLSMHKLYTLQPPHDSTLYDILDVSPNATMAQITKSYRRKSRQYHPDKIILHNDNHNTNNNNDNNNNDKHHHHHQLRRQQNKAKIQLQQVQQSYEILKEDSTRLMYHKYGLIDPSLAVVLLMGPQHSSQQQQQQSSNQVANHLHHELLQLMGYSPEESSTTTTLPSNLHQPPPPPPPPPKKRPTTSTRSGSRHHHHHHQTPRYQHKNNNNNYDKHKNDVLLENQRQRQQQQRLRHKQRVARLAAQLVERIRPLVEGSMDEQFLAHSIADECDKLKTLPLGAQIIRCIGRAYKHSGQDYLQRHKHTTNNQLIEDYYYNTKKKKKDDYNDEVDNHNMDPPFDYDDSLPSLSSSSLIRTPQKVVNDMSVSMRQQFRQAKHYWTAALASGRVVWTEQKYTRQERKRQAQKRKRKQQRQTSSSSQIPQQQLDYYEIGDGLDFLNDSDDMDDYYDFDEEDEEEAKELERLKAQKALLQSLQVEALWKISKIDLDQTIREACHLILEGDYFFFPSHSYNTQPPPPPPPSDHYHYYYDSQANDSFGAAGHVNGDGWVAASSGKTIYADIARLRAAAAMAMIGDVMVHCSKAGTSWKE